MKSLKLPNPENPQNFRLRSDEMFFLDLIIMTNENPAELYRRVFITSETPVSASRKAAVLMNSVEGKTYTESRRAQLESWYFPGEHDKHKEKIKHATIEDALNDLQPTFINELYAIMNNRSDPNFADTIKIFLTKSIKDIQMDKTATPPLRYLPENCGSCRYKLFIEKEVEDECSRCKYREFGQKNGLNYDHRTQLNPKDEVI